MAMTLMDLGKSWTSEESPLGGKQHLGKPDMGKAYSHGSTVLGGSSIRGGNLRIK